VALLVPTPLASEIDGLRRALGDGALARVPPHLTLVPPVNVRVERVPDALAVLRDAAAACSPLTLRLGPPTTFRPDTPTVHLGVTGDDEQVAALGRLRDAVFVPPLERDLTFGFVPHVTLSDEVDADRIDAACVVLDAYEVEATFDRVHLLQEQRHGDAHRRWVPIADVPLAPRVVVGRGGVELELTTSELIDPEAVAFETGEWPDDEPRPPVPDLPAGCRPIVVVARHRGEVVGVARGGSAPDRTELVSVLVAQAHRGLGISRHLVAAFDHAAAADTGLGRDTGPNGEDGR
jgi:2'-5' RNA ligase